MQLLQGSSELWLPKQKPQQVPLRLPAQLLQVPIVPSPQLFLQQHSCKFWLYPAHGLPLDSPIPSVPQGMVLDSAKLAESGALLQRYWTETVKHWQFLENCWLSPSNPVHLVILQEVTLSMSTKSEQVLVKAPKKTESVAECLKVYAHSNKHCRQYGLPCLAQPKFISAFQGQNRVWGLYLRLLFVWCWFEPINLAF